MITDGAPRVYYFDEFKSQFILLSDHKEAVKGLETELAEALKDKQQILKIGVEGQRELNRMLANHNDDLNDKVKRQAELMKNLIEAFKAADASLMGRDITVKVLHDSMKFVREEIIAVEAAILQEAK